MSALLWTLAIIGTWNAINMILRIYYKAPWTPYAFHVAIGAWSIFLLLSHKG